MHKSRNQNSKIVVSDKENTSIFLSYSWQDYQEANKIDADFKNAGIQLIRDIRMSYKDNIPSFMERIRHEDYAILLISISYLQSINCMNEVLELIQDKEYDKKILPIILPNTNIFNIDTKIQLIKYWENRITELNNKIKELDSLANVSEIIKEVECATKIRGMIDEFLAKLTDFNCKTYKELTEQNYKPILDLIGIIPRDLSSLILSVVNIKNLEERENAIDQLLEKNPGVGNLVFLKANIALYENKFDKAQRLYLNLIEKNPTIAELHNNLGVCYRDQGEISKAINSFKKAIEIDPNYSDSYCNLGLTYKEQIHDLDMAQEYYEKSLKLNDESGETHFNYALLMHDKKEYFSAKAHYETALNIYNTFSTPEKIAGVHFCFANLLFMDLKDFENAKIQYEHCLSIDPKHFKAHCNYAVLLKNIFRNYEKACYHYHKALDIEPLDVITHNNLGNLYSQHLEKPELAQFHYFKTIEIDEKYTDAYVGLGNLNRKNSPIEALKYYEKALSINPASVNAVRNYAILLNMLNSNSEHK